MALCFVVSREAARIFPITLAMLYLLLQSLQETLTVLQDSGNLVRVPSRINYTRVMLAPAMQMFDIGIALMWGSGKQILVVSNYVTLRMYNVLPFAVYLAGPVIGTFVLFFMQVALPRAVQIHHKSVAGLTKAINLGNTNKYVSKYAKATRPLAFRAGTGKLVFCYLKLDFMRDFYQSIATSTTDALLAF